MSVKPLYWRLLLIQDQFWLESSCQGHPLAYRTMKDAKVPVSQSGLFEGLRLHPFQPKIVKLVPNQVEALVGIPFGYRSFLSPLGQTTGAILFKDQEGARALWENGRQID